MSRRVLKGYLILSLLFAVPSFAEPDRDAMLLAYFEVWNSGEIDRLDTMVAADFRRNGGPDEACGSRAELKQLITQARTNFKRFRLTLDDYMTEERGGAMRGSFYGVHAEVDRIVEFPMMSMVRFDDGLIAEEWILASNFLVLVGLGFQLTPPGFAVFDATGEPVAPGAPSPVLPSPSGGAGAFSSAAMAPPRITDHSTTTAEQTMSDILRAYAEVWNTGELDRLDDLVTEDFQRHGGFGPADSRAKLKRVIEGSRRFYRDLDIEVHGAVANPDKGAMRWRFTGGWGKTDFELDALNFAMYRFTGGKISEERVMGNNMDLFRTFGYRLTPPHHKIVPPPIEQPPGPGLAARMAPRRAELAAYAEQTLRDTSKSAGKLEIRSPVGCRLFLDGRPIGALEPEGSVTLHLSRGKHGVRVASFGGSVFFEQDVVVRKGKTTTVEVEAPGRVVLQPRQRTTEDLTTGLMWQMTDNGENATLAAATDYCRDLDQGGYDDWRLPTIHELQGIHEPAASKRYHSIAGIQLSDCCPWSSTPHGDFYWTYAFSMDMRYLQYETLGFHMRVLCVRDAVGAVVAKAPA